MTHQTSISSAQATSSATVETTQVWIIRPHRALTWVQAKRWLYLLSLVPATSGLLFLACGVPLVLPFAGLEVLLLWAAFYYVSYTGQWREVVKLEESQVVVEKGRHRPIETYRFDRGWVRIQLRGAPYAWYPSRLSLTSHGREVSLGDFLTEAERVELARALINAIEKTR